MPNGMCLGTQYYHNHYKNIAFDRNSTNQESVKCSLSTESTHLVETEFKILQSLIPGISDQRDISEVGFSLVSKRHSKCHIRIVNFFLGKL